jgi:hemerythrin-like domain-containing protein
MTYANRISQTLHEEHRATIALMERLEHLIGRHQRGGPPDRQDRAVAQLLSELSVGVTAEVQRHFDFEERQLFPYLEAAGDQAIGVHLTSEHEAMRPLGIRLAALAREASGAGFGEADWAEFRRIGQELAERMLAHVQKEEMALLPMLDEALDAGAEERLYQDYVENV